MLTKSSMKQLFGILILLMAQTVAWAQDSISTTTTTTRTSETWYMSPWVWVAGGLVFILLLAAILRGGSSNSGSTDRVTITKTVSKDSDV
jgi:hypothetical protein